MLSFFSLRSSLKSVLINCSLLLLLQSSHSSRTGQWPSNLFQFPLLFKSFSAFCQFSPSSFFPICCKLKIVPQKAITAVVKSLNITARLYTQREYNNLQLLDYTHRVSFVTITTYNCLHCNSCNVPKITKSSLKNSKVAKCSKVTRSTGLWTLPPAWGSFARTANFQPRNSGGKSDCLHLFYRHFVFSDLDLIDWWRFVNLK